MNIEEIRKAYETDEMLEYHVMGGEIDPDHLLPAHGWYPCEIVGVWKNGNVEIDLTTPNHPVPLQMTVLKRNIPIAFRRKQEVAS